MNLSRIYEIDTLAVKNAAMKVVGVLQRESKATFLTGIACTFIEVCKVLRADPRAVLDASDRVMRASADKHPVEYRALRRFIADDIATKAD